MRQLILFAFLLVAWSPLVQAWPHRPSTQTPSPVVATPTTPAPSLTAAEQARKEALILLGQLSTAMRQLAVCQGALGPLQAQGLEAVLPSRFQALKADVEQTHPGWTLSDAGELDRSATEVNPRSSCRAR